MRRTVTITYHVPDNTKEEILDHVEEDMFVQLETLEDNYDIKVSDCSIEAKSQSTDLHGYKFYKNGALHVVIAGPDDMGNYTVKWPDGKGRIQTSFFWSHEDIVSNECQAVKKYK